MTLPERQIFHMGPLLRLQWRHAGDSNEQSIRRGRLWIERDVLERIKVSLIPMAPPGPPSPPGLHPSPCWVWTGPVDAEGRGVVYNQESRWPVHRLLYVIDHGPLPDRIHLFSKCGNPRCCNPRHQDAVPRGPVPRPAGGEGMYPRCKRGHLLSPANTYVFQGKTMCRDCRAQAQSRYRRRQSSASPSPASGPLERPATEWSATAGDWTG